MLQVERLEGRSLLAGLTLAPLGTYFAPDGATTEIAAYDKTSQRVFFTSATDNALGIVDLSNPAAPTEVAMIDLSPWGGGPNSVAVRDGLVAVAVEANVKTDLGSVVFFDNQGNYLGQILVGALPDMLTFTADGQKLLVANEGEPNSYNQMNSVDPEGSISIIDMGQGLMSATVATADFTAFNGQENSLRAAGIRIFGPNASVAQDLEPEYIAVSPDGTTAYVTLQENNAFAVVDIASATVSSLVPLGYKDHLLPGNGLDASDRDVPGSSNAGIINIRNWPVLGMYQPDAVASFSIGGQTYLLTANEGDARDYTGYSEESRVSGLTLDAATFASQGYPDVSNALTGLRNNDNLGRLTVTTANGNTDADAEFEQLFAFGGRSFSIWDSAGQLVFDSGDQLEQITAAAFPAYFNAGHDDNNFDSRSDNKGPEPEAATVARIGGRTYGFIGLERIGGIMVFDLSNPSSPSFVQYINNRDFTQPNSSNLAKDLGTEDLKFIPADESPTGTPLLLSVNEISGSITAFSVQPSSGLSVTGDGVLEIVGTAGDDTLTIRRQGQNLVVQSNFLTPATQLVAVDNVQSIHVLMEAGADRVRVERNVQVPITVEGWSGNDDVYTGGGRATVLGGAGNDVLRSDIAAAILVGGTGNDLLVAGPARSLLIGGEGADRLMGSSNQDLLIGGTTDYDTHVIALDTIRDTWAGPSSFALRQASLQAGIASSLGTVRLVDGDTVLDDATTDLLFSGPNQDWLLAGTGDIGQ